MLQEIWKPVVDYEGYEVSNIGRVRSIPRSKTYVRQSGTLCTVSYKGRVLKSFLKTGYEVVYLSKDSITKEFLVHRLVAQAFVPNPNRLPQVNHIDGVKTNNTVANLEWCDASYNCKHAVRIGLKDEALKKISFSVIDLTTGHVYKSCSEAERQLSLSSGCVSEGIKTHDKFIRGHVFERYDPCKEYSLIDSDDSTDLEGEIWIPVRGYENLYCVSNKGRVQSTRLSTDEWKYILNPDVHNGYASVTLSKAGKSFSTGLGRLVFESFVRDLNQTEQVLHIDGDVANNDVSNLRAGTVSDAYKISVKTGKITHEKLVEYQKKGSKKRCKPVKDLSTGKIYGSMKDADEDLGFRKDTVSDLIRENRSKDGHRFCRLQQVEIGGVTYGKQ